MREQVLSRWSGALLVPVAIITALLVASIFPNDVVLKFLAEDGPIEELSAIAWLVLAAIILIFTFTHERRAWPFALLAALAGARELDIHKLFTSVNFTKASVWFNEELPLQEQLLVIALTLPIAIALGYALFKNFYAMRRAFARGEPWIRTLIVLLAFVAALKFVDSVPDSIRELTGDKVSPSLRGLLSSLEEVGELFLPLMGFFCLAQFTGWQWSGTSADQPARCRK